MEKLCNFENFRLMTSRTRYWRRGPTRLSRITPAASSLANQDRYRMCILPKYIHIVWGFLSATSMSPGSQALNSLTLHPTLMSYTIISHFRREFKACFQRCLSWTWLLKRTDYLLS